MEKIKVLVISHKTSPEFVTLSSTKDVQVNADYILKKDTIFYSVTTEIYDQMKKPKSVYIWLINGLLFAEPII